MKLIFSAVLILLVISVSSFFIFRADSSQPAESETTEYIAPAGDAVSQQAQAYILPVSEPSYIPILNSNIQRPIITAKAAIVYDVRSSKFLYQENIRQRVPIASLTKVLTAAVLFERLDTNDVMTVTSDVLRVDGQKQDLYAGEQIKIGDLIRMMLVASSNDAAAALAAYSKTKGFDLVDAMNEKAKVIGMNDSHFLDPAGLNDEGYSTVYDLIKLVRATTKHRSIWDTLIEKEIQVSSVDGRIVHNLKNTDELLGVIPNIIGGKTGFTDGAQGCLVLLVSLPEYNDTVVSIVLGSKDRFGDTQKIIDWVKRAYRWE